jgi:hypothetical protein
MCRLTRLTQLCATALLVAVALVTGSSSAAPTELSRAGLVIDHGDGRMAYVLVSFEEEEISGAELIDRSGLTVTEVSFGGLGVAVCAIDETGCDVATCRKRVCQGPARDDPYWQYFTGSEEGTWRVAVLGLNADSVRDGDVRAFVWSAGVPEYPAPSVDEVARLAGESGANGVALTRYAQDGTVAEDEAGDDSTDVPYAGIVVVLIAVVIVGGVVARKRSGGRR